MCLIICLCKQTQGLERGSIGAWYCPPDLYNEASDPNVTGNCGKLLDTTILDITSITQSDNLLVASMLFTL